MIKFGTLATIMEYIKGAQTCLNYFIQVGNVVEAQKEMKHIEDAYNRMDTLATKMFGEMENEKVVVVVEEAQEQKTIYVACNWEYGWSVTVDGEGESRDDYLTKEQAMKLARKIKKTGNFVIEAETLTKEQRKELLSARWDRALNLGYKELGYY